MCKCLHFQPNADFKSCFRCGSRPTGSIHQQHYTAIVSRRSIRRTPPCSTCTSLPGATCARTWVLYTPRSLGLLELFVFLELLAQSLRKLTSMASFKPAQSEAIFLPAGPKHCLRCRCCQPTPLLLTLVEPCKRIASPIHRAQYSAEVAPCSAYSGLLPAPVVFSPCSAQGIEVPIPSQFGIKIGSLGHSTTCSRFIIHGQAWAVEVANIHGQPGAAELSCNV